MTFFLFLLIWIWITVRGSFWAAYRSKLLTHVSLAADTDIILHRPFRWRFETLRSVSFHKGWWQFWRTFSSFYPDLSFIDPEAVSPPAPCEAD